MLTRCLILRVKNELARNFNQTAQTSTLATMKSYAIMLEIKYDETCRSKQKETKSEEFWIIT